MRPFDIPAAFHEAVLDLNDAPTLVNVRRYLAASRLLEEVTHDEHRISGARRHGSAHGRPPDPGRR
jgi:hypothetical protein